MFCEPSSSTNCISIFDRSKPELLPLEVVSRVGMILLGVDAKDPYYLHCLAFGCGIFTNPKQEGQAVVVPWSPLIEYASSPVDRLPLDELLSLAAAFIQEHFATAVTQLHESALNLLLKQFPRACIYQLSKGHCIKEKTQECTWSHGTPTEPQAVAKVTCLLKIAELFSRLTPLYYSHSLPETFSKHFLGRRMLLSKYG
jgi:hypothetical protein